MPTPIQERREFWLFFLVALVILSAGIGLRDPWPADEPRFALAAKQMVESGNWLIPHRGSELYSDKPPAFMVLQAATYTLIGNWRIAFLLPSLLAALGTLFLIYDLARRLWNPRVGLYAAGVLLATFQFVYQAKRAQIDPTVTFFLTMANYGLLRHFLLGPDWRAYWLGCFAAGLGVITKGVGVLALLMFIPYLFARMRHWEHIAITQHSSWRWLSGGGAFIVAIALWLIPMLAAVHGHNTVEYQTYANDILFHQTAGRYTESWDHHQPAWYYLGVILTSWLPLTLLLPGTLSHWRHRIKQRDARFLLPLTWVLLVIFFFSLSKGKRDVYIMPALPLVALCVSPFIHKLIEKAWLQRAAYALITLIGVTFLSTGLYALLAYPRFAQKLAEQRGLALDGAWLWWLLIALGVWTLGSAAVFRPRRGVHALLAGIAGMWMLWSLWAYPVLNASSSAAGVMRQAGALIGTDAELGLVAWKEQNRLLADRTAIDFGFSKPWPVQLSDAIRWQEAAPDKRWIFVLADAMAPCIDKNKSAYVGHSNRREWWLFRMNAVATECRNGVMPTSQSEDLENPNVD